MRDSLFFPILAVSLASSFKFLAYNPQFARSHVNFIGRLVDVLVEAGHEVVGSVQNSPMHHSTRSGRASERSSRSSSLHVGYSDNYGDAESKNYESLQLAMTSQCNATLTHPGLLERLKEEKFDVAFSETFDFCGFGIFHLLNIDKYVVTQSVALVEDTYVTHFPIPSSYVPGLLGAAVDEKMSFLERFENAMGSFMTSKFLQRHVPVYQEIFEGIQPSFPSVKEIVSNGSLVFVNSEPLLDFPRPTAHRIVDIGGIIVPTEIGTLNTTWSSILNLRPKTVLLSFGTFAKAHLMPEQYKRTIRDTFAKFPNVTFIWKYEKPEHHVSGNVSNIVESTWVPQVELLRDPRLSLFITHCGLGSTIEANTAGIPLLVIPVTADQERNAQLVKRNRLGVLLHKTDLEREGPLEKALHEMLDSSFYRENARHAAKMVVDRPFPIRDIFIRNMEFLALHGPLRQLDHYGRHLSFIQYYLIDIFASVAAFILLVTVAIFLILRKLAIFLSSFISIKKKND